jgi:hypothetical protein
MARRDFVEYLALNWPSSGELLRALAITAILLLVEFWPHPSSARGNIRVMRI